MPSANLKSITANAGFITLTLHSFKSRNISSTVGEQVSATTAMLVYAFWKIESRIQTLERNMELALTEIDVHNEERKAAEEKHIKDIQEQLEWYETELNLNPFSWGKKKRKKK